MDPRLAALIEDLKIADQSKQTFSEYKKRKANDLATSGDLSGILRGLSGLTLSAISDDQREAAYIIGNATSILKAGIKLQRNPEFRAKVIEEESIQVAQQELVSSPKFGRF